MVLISLQCLLVMLWGGTAMVNVFTYIHTCTHTHINYTHLIFHIFIMYKRIDTQFNVVDTQFNVVTSTSLPYKHSYTFLTITTEPLRGPKHMQLRYRTKRVWISLEILLAPINTALWAPILGITKVKPHLYLTSLYAHKERLLTVYHYQSLFWLSQYLLYTSWQLISLQIR